MAKMVVLHKGSVDQISMLEAALICHFKTAHLQELQNVQPGGEGISNKCGQEVFCYVVYKFLHMRPTSQ